MMIIEFAENTMFTLPKVSYIGRKT